MNCPPYLLIAWRKPAPERPRSGCLENHGLDRSACTGFQPAGTGERPREPRRAAFLFPDGTFRTGGGPSMYVDGVDRLCDPPDPGAGINGGASVLEFGRRARVADPAGRSISVRTAVVPCCWNHQIAPPITGAPRVVAARTKPWPAAHIRGRSLRSDGLGRREALPRRVDSGFCRLLGSTSADGSCTSRLPVSYRWVRKRITGHPSQHADDGTSEPYEQTWAGAVPGAR